jgi:glycosyltransferase involved in cell wall biosynthesis
VPAWAAAVHRLVDEPGRRDAMGIAAAAYVARELSLDAAADRLARAYARIAS